MKTSRCRQRLHDTGLSLRNTLDGLEWDQTKTQRASQSVTALDSQLGRVRCHTRRVRCSIGRKLRNSLRQQFSPNSLHRTKTQRVLQTELARTLTSDTSNLIPYASGVTSDVSDLTSDVSGLYALHETIFNFFPCFHVPTPKCHNTCASVLAFSQTFFQGS